MGLRDQTVTGTPPETKKELRRIILTKEGIETAWMIQWPDGRREEKRVEVTRALAQTINGRATFQTMIDNITDDTSPRVL